MKWTSMMIAAAIFAGPATAEDGADLLRTPRAAAPLSHAQPDEGRPIAPGTFALTPLESSKLLQAARGATLRLPSIDAHLGTAAQPLEFTRYEAFAAGARVLLASPGGVTRIDPRLRHYFIASGPAEGVGLALDPVSGEISGFASRGDSRVELSGFAGIGIEVTAVTDQPDAVNECGTTLDGQPGEIVASLDLRGMASQSEAPQGTTISFQAVVAIDTDTEWMAGKGNNPTTATNWITDLFLAMNVFYERDVETRLLIGDVTLRVGTDPYNVPSNRSDQLDEFGEYWRVNMAAVDRDFAAMLSGRNIGAGSFSGIAWLDQYCQKGYVFGTRTAGSYSFNAIGSGRTPANTAPFVGHELGHNMGSPHTHCYSPAVDQCYNAESGCYSGSVSCPAGGKGTIMSYCHFGAPSGANCGSSKQEFHPTVQGLLENRLAANSPNCIAPYAPPGAEMILVDGFEIP